MPYPMLHKKRQWYALEMCREVWQTDTMARLVQACYDKYPERVCGQCAKG